MPSTNSTPRNWPPHLIYLKQPHLANINPTTLSPSYSFEKTPIKLLQPPHPPGPSPLVRITPIKDPVHPACGQHGLFATRDLLPDTFILFYLGELHGPTAAGAADDEHGKSDYDLSLDRELELSIDAVRMGNEARFTNDYRGIRNAGPNAEFRDVWIEVNDASKKGGEVQVQKRIGLFVLPAGKSGKRKGGVRKGEEVLVSYGKGFWSHRGG